MKRVLSIVLITLFLITFCILEEILVRNTLFNLNEKANAIYAVAENQENVNTEEVLTLSRDLNKFWLENENLLCFFVNHKDMHEMGNEIIKMISYSKNNIKEEFMTSLELVIYYTSTFTHIMGVSLQNIF